MTDDQLICRLYRAASGLEAWPAVLDRVAESFDGGGVHIVGIDKMSGQIELELHTSNTPTEGVGDPVRASDAHDPQAAIGADIPVGQVINNRGKNGQPLVGTPIHWNRLMPDGYRYFIGGKICDDDDLVVLMGVGRGPHHHTFSIQEERRLGRMLIHFSNAMDLMRGAREWHARSDVGETLLGRSLRPSFLVGPEAKLLFANGAGRDALKQARVVVNRQGVLAARDSQANAKLQCALCTLGMLGPDAPGKCPDRIALWLNDVSCGDRVPACLWAVRANRALGALGAETIGLLILATTNPSTRAVPNPMVLASMFGFTPAEARIAAHLISGAAPKQVAAALDLGMPTVRHHIRQLLTKCGSRDQRQLVRRLSQALEVNGL
jgi:DNA-binding CsgD family transcriptional regulator